MIYHLPAHPINVGFITEKIEYDVVGYVPQFIQVNGAFCNPVGYFASFDKAVKWIEEGVSFEYQVSFKAQTITPVESSDDEVQWFIS